MRITSPRKVECTCFGAGNANTSFRMESSRRCGHVYCHTLSHYHLSTSMASFKISSISSLSRYIFTFSVDGYFCLRLVIYIYFMLHIVYSASHTCICYVINFFVTLFSFSLCYLISFFFYAHNANDFFIPFQMWSKKNACILSAHLITVSPFRTFYLLSGVLVIHEGIARLCGRNFTP